MFRMVPTLFFPEKTSSLRFENRVRMLFFDVLTEIAHVFSWPKRRGVKLFFADGASSDADVCVGNWFQKYLLFHGRIMPPK